jgi:hypothetical protein
VALVLLLLALLVLARRSFVARERATARPQAVPAQ